MARARRGLTAALTLAPHARVRVLAKGEGSTAWAQGGIAAVLEPGDTFAAHIEDTLVAGAGLCRRETVEFVVENAPAAIERLAVLGVPFTPGETVSERFHLTQEGGHRTRRIVHVDDMTGWAVAQALQRAAAAHPNIELLTDRVAIDLIGPKHTGVGGAHGAYAFNTQTGRVETHAARATILATGGAGRAYRFTTNPDGSTGDGIAMAWRAGCRVANMEFNQFHPTCLYNAKVKNFLLTEALRGEGAYLRLPTTGERFMPALHPMAELAPRDIVARAIDGEMKRLGLEYVHLDISHREPAFIEAHFPGIQKKLARTGAGSDRRTGSRRARRALHLRRRSDRSCGPDRRAGPVRDRRGELLGAARREPHGVQLAFGVSCVRPVRRRRCSGRSGGSCPLRPPAAGLGREPRHAFGRGGGGQP